jgi:hypothetical protein
MSRALFVMAGYCAAVATILFWQWLVNLDARSVWCVPSTGPEGWARGGAVLHSRFTGLRANATPRAGQVWKSSDPRRLSAFRIIDVVIRKGREGWADAELITNPGISGRTAMRIPLPRFQVLGHKGYTRVS